MELTITARHFKLKNDLRSHVETKSQKLSRYHSGIVSLEVVLSLDKQDHVAELILSVNSGRIVVKEGSEDFRKSFDTALDKAQRQLKRHKAKTQQKEGDVINSA